MTRIISEVKYDSQTGDYYLEFHPELLDQLGWYIGDTLIWEDNKDGTFSIKKKMDDTTSDSKTDEKSHGATEEGTDRDT